MEKIIKLRLRELLEERNLTRNQLAKMIGEDYQMIDRYYKNAIYRYDSRVLAKICAALNCNVQDLVELAEADD
ncbi:MAG: helix-turn-helix domain-containing protein [Intestinibacillus sp.]